MCDNSDWGINHELWFNIYELWWFNKCEKKDCSVFRRIFFSLNSYSSAFLFWINLVLKFKSSNTTKITCFWIFKCNVLYYDTITIYYTEEVLISTAFINNIPVVNVIVLDIILFGKLLTIRTYCVSNIMMKGLCPVMAVCQHGIYH